MEPGSKIDVSSLAMEPSGTNEKAAEVPCLPAPHARQHLQELTAGLHKTKKAMEAGQPAYRDSVALLRQLDEELRQR
jgi:hypothetical protein